MNETSGLKSLFSSHPSCAWQHAASSATTHRASLSINRRSLSLSEESVAHRPHRAITTRGSLLTPSSQCCTRYVVFLLPHRAPYANHLAPLPPSLAGC